MKYILCPCVCYRLRCIWPKKMMSRSLRIWPYRNLQRNLLKIEWIRPKLLKHRQFHTFSFRQKYANFDTLAIYLRKFSLFDKTIDYRHDSNFRINTQNRSALSKIRLIQKNTDGLPLQHNHRCFLINLIFDNVRLFWTCKAATDNMCFLEPKPPCWICRFTSAEKSKTQNHRLVPASFVKLKFNK